MRRGLVALAASAAIGAGACTVRSSHEIGLSHTEAAASDRAAIAARSREFSEAYMRGDVDAMLAIYTGDAVIFPPRSEAISGAAAIRRYWRLPPGQRITVHRARPAEIVVDGGHAYDHGTYEVSGVRDGTAWGPTRGKYVIVWRREPEGWRMQLDMWNSLP